MFRIRFIFSLDCILLPLFELREEYNLQFTIINLNMNIK